MDTADCMGCLTARGGSGADEVYRDDRVVVVVAQHAVNPGHLVVVTVEHVRNALTMELDLYAHVCLVARELAVRLRAALPCESVMLLFNNEPPCQSLMHAHMHIVPRLSGDSMDHPFGQGVPPEERSALASRLRLSMTRPQIGPCASEDPQR